jgi:signal recognition particle receptor subunit beta
MSLINYAGREINCKIVYYGTGLGGKTTNLEYVYWYDLTTIPFAMQYNKRDLPNAMPMADLRAQLNPMGVPDFEGVATEGRGVFETLGAVSKMVVQALN